MILETLRANNYITVSVGGGQFPTFGGVYQPTELSVYGVGYTIGQDHTFMTEILNVVFNRNNCYASIPRTKQFSGNVYTNLELNDRIYYSVDGTFYNNGTTTVGGGTVIGANGFSVSFNVSGSSSYFADINHSGRWYG